MTIGNNQVVEGLTVGNVSINSSAIAVGDVSLTPTAISTPSLIVGGVPFGGGMLGGIIDYKEFTANSTWYNPYANASVNSSLTGYEQVLVMAWGGGGGGASNNTIYRGGGGGACSLGYYTLSFLANSVSVIVGLGGTSSRTTTTAVTDAGNGGNSSFDNLDAYGGSGGGATAAGGGGGTLSAGSQTSGGNPLPGSVSTYGGGNPSQGLSIFGGGGGGAANTQGGSSVYGGGGGAGGAFLAPFEGGQSILGGKGGDVGSNNAAIPGGGGGCSNNIAYPGARGEVRVWVIGPGSTTAGLPTYTLTANTTSVTEGSSVLYTISTTNVANNTTLYYTLNNSSTAVATDFTTAVNGSVVINSGTGTFTLTANNDADASESFQMDIRTGNSTGTIVVSNGSVSIVPFTGGDITVVSTSVAQADGANSVSLSMPSGVQQNDLVIISQVTDAAPVVPSGWTAITFTPVPSTNFRSFYKFMGAVPDTSVTVRTTSSGAGSSIAAVAIALRNANTSPLDGTATSTLNNSEDPAAITTSKANSYVIIAGFAHGGFGSITNPSGYTQANAISNPGEGTTVLYKKVTTAGLENPPTFTIGADNYGTVTFAIKNNTN